MARRRSSAARRRARDSSSDRTGNRPSGDGADGERRAGRTGAGARAGSRGRTAGRGARSDGKVDIFCPQCGAQFRLPEDGLDAKVKCTQCYRVFFPQTAVDKRPRPKDNTKVYVGFGILAVFVIASFIIMSSSGNSRAKSSEPVVRPPPVELGARNPRVMAVMSWADKIAAGDTFGITEGTDMDGARQLFEIEPDQDYKNTTGVEREALDSAILAAFKEHEKARYLRDLSCTHGELGDDSMAESDRGKILLHLNTPDTDRYAESKCRIEVDFRMDGKFAKVTGWNVVKKPLEKVRRSGDRYIPHDQIAKPTIRTETYRGQEVEVTESEPVPLEHLEDTPAELRAEIDQLVDDVINIDGPGGLFNRATDKLRKMGRPAIPRLLNKLYELHGDTTGNNLQLSNLCRCLRQITGNAYAYPVADVPGKTASQLQEERLSAVKQWYAWWYRYHKGEFDLLIDKRENLEEPLPDEIKPDKKKT